MTNPDLTKLDDDSKSTPGADLLRRLYFFDSSGELDGGTATQIVSNIVAFGFTSAVSTCDQGIVISQEMAFDCNQAGKGDEVRQNENCTLCKSQVAAVMADRMKLEALAASRNPNYTIQTAKPELLADIQGLLPDSSDGACKYVCLQCIARDVSQTIQVRLTENCNMDTEQFATAFSSGLNAAAQNQLNQYKDKLTAMGAQLSSPDLVRKASIHLSDTIRNITNSAVLNELNQRVVAAQQLIIEPGSTSVVIQNVKQAITVNMIASIASQLYTQGKVTAAIGYTDEDQENFNQIYSLRNLVNSLANSIDTMEDALSDSVVRIAIILIVMLITSVLIFASLFFFKPSIIFGGALDNPEPRPKEK